MKAILGFLFAVFCFTPPPLVVDLVVRFWGAPGAPSASCGGAVDLTFAIVEDRWMGEGDWKREPNNKTCHSVCIPPLTLHTLTFNRQPTTAMSATHCAGCNRTFTGPRYRLSHLSQTNNPACLAVKHALLTPDSEAPPPASLPQDTPLTLSISPPPSQTSPTPADHRRTTLDNRLDSRDEIRDENTSYREDSLDDEDYLDPSVTSDDDDFEGSETSDDVGDGSDHADISTNMGDEEHGRLLTESEVTQSQGESWVEPTIVHYPGKRAGEVCSEGITTMQEYENTLGGPSENPYFPFSSQIDWELAKWAKLRGPSATSFTELLNISGVSKISGPLWFVVSPHLASCTSN